MAIVSGGKCIAREANKKEKKFDIVAKPFMEKRYGHVMGGGGVGGPC